MMNFIVNRKTDDRQTREAMLQEELRQSLQQRNKKAGLDAVSAATTTINVLGG